MKVLLVGAANSIHLQRWANALAEQGVTVACATLHAPLPTGWHAAVELRVLRPAGGRGYLLAAASLRRWFVHGGFDLMHAHYATGYGLLATLSGIRPRLLSVWGSDVDEFPQKSPFHAALLRWILRRADALAATSQALARRVQQLLPRTEQPLFLTPFGVDVELFRAAAAQMPEAPHFIVGCSKGLARTYGIDILLQAFARLPAQAPDGRPVHLHLLGSGPQDAEYRAWVVKSGLQDRVKFLGALPHAQVVAAVQAMDIFAAPSRQESFGVAVLEASACEKPVVVSRVGGLPEIVQHENTGLLVPPGDARALATALNYLVARPEQRRSFGQAGRSLVVEHYRWSDCVQTMLAAYQQLLRRP